MVAAGKIFQPLLHIFDFLEAGIGILPKIQEFVVILYGFGLVALMFMGLAQLGVAFYI